MCINAEIYCATFGRIQRFVWWLVYFSRSVATVKLHKPPTTTVTKCLLSVRFRWTRPIPYSHSTGAAFASGAHALWASSLSLFYIRRAIKDGPEARKRPKQTHPTSADHSLLPDFTRGKVSGDFSLIDSNHMYGTCNFYQKHIVSTLHTHKYIYYQ